MPVPSGVICLWPSTVASIPSGWTRETALDARYIKGAATAADADLAADLGNATHTHASPSHAPTQPSHGHNVSSDTHTPQEMSDTPPRDPVQGTHAHGIEFSGLTTATINGLAITVDTASNDLSFVEAIFIKSDGNPAGIPAGAYACFESDTLPTNWVRVHGDRYPKGAAAAGGGGGTGGSNTHAHTSPSHVHTSPTHSHTGISLAAPNTGGSINNSPAALFVQRQHTHAYTLVGVAQDWNAVTTTIAVADGQPPFAKLNLIRNDNAGADLPTNLVALWGGTHAGIPAGWSRVTFMDGRFLKDANVNGESGVATGGGTQHLHTASSCDPVEAGGGHTHPVTASEGTPTVLLTDVAEVGSADRGALSNHTHTWTDSGANVDATPVAVTIDNCTSEAAFPKHRTVIFIRFVTAVVEKVPFTRAVLLAAALSTWQAIEFPAQARPKLVQVEAAVPLVRAWLSIVIGSWRDAPPAERIRPRVIAPLDLPFVRRWLSRVLEQWLPGLSPAQRRIVRYEESFPVVPPPTPEEPCFPRVDVAPAAFDRMAPVSGGYSRQSIPGSYARASVGSFSGSRMPGPASPFGRSVEPECVTLGYGDGYGIDYGGS